jgi:hypothetical protein
MNTRGLASVFKDAIGHLRRAKTRHAVSFAVLVLSFLMAGLFLSLSNNLRERARALSKDVAVIVYFTPAASADEQQLAADPVRRSPWSLPSVRFSGGSPTASQDIPRPRRHRRKSRRVPSGFRRSDAARSGRAGIFVAGLMNELRRIPGKMSSSTAIGPIAIRAPRRLIDANGLLTQSR